MPQLDRIENALICTGWNRARVRLLARFLVALIACRSVCLYRLAAALPGEAKTLSHFRRLQRFVAHFDLDTAALARLVLTLSGLCAPFALAMDRTNWRLGKTELNLLVLAVVHRGVAFPVFWSVLAKSGNSNLAERKALLGRFVAVFGKQSIAYLLADREFCGRAFAAWLQKEGIGFVVRVRGNVRMTNARGQVRTARALFWNQKSGQALPLGRRHVFGGKPLALYVAGMRLPQGDFAIVISDTEEALLERYGRRWGIETLFSCLKRRGFDLEGTHLTRPERLERLLAVLALAFVWAYVSGAWLYEQQPWRVKKHGRLARSLFRAGLDWLQRLFLPLCGGTSPSEFDRVVRFLSCT